MQPQTKHLPKVIILKLFPSMDLLMTKIEVTFTTGSPLLLNMSRKVLILIITQHYEYDDGKLSCLILNPIF